MTWMQLPQDIEWHFIGRLQSNKVKTLLGMLRFYHYLVSVFVSFFTFSFFLVVSIKVGLS